MGVFGSMRPLRLIALLSCSTSALFVFLFKYYDIENKTMMMDDGLPKMMKNCSDVLARVDPPFQALLIDERIIERLSRTDCGTTPTQIRLGVDMELFPSVGKKNYSDYEIVYYQNLTDKDYLRFNSSPTRIIPRIPIWVHGNLSIPSDTKHFLEFWKRSKLVKCRGMKVDRNIQSRILPIEKTLKAMSSLMSYITNFDIYPFLNGGTLLGWYRECDIIPHTTDVDFAALIEEHNPDLLTNLQNNGTKFRLTRILGRVNDSYEFTFKPLDSDRLSVDLFWMYSSENDSWVGGTSSDGSKYKYTYPKCVNHDLVTICPIY
ncbi:unnamed protein product [Angiostrongylus costaricensis]|uniref:Fukutin n=1 Tax=Angiostrongylus costaricensis TaxID=334426 RepID=A0A158PDE4_ANGCS|nr:unnamed protein product [Angiostrongylus costaricensis]